MPITNKELEAFTSEYQKEEKEILVLTSDDNGSAAKFYNLWNPSNYFLAYVDGMSNELKVGEGRLEWLLSDEEEREIGFESPYYFKKGVIYRLKIRELINKTVPKNRIPSYGNRLMVVEIIEENVPNKELLDILAEYRTPVTISDETLGEFTLNKNLAMFEGEINWLGENIAVFMEVNINNKASWTKAINVLRTLFEQRKQKDFEFRTFAAEHLTNLANEWREDEKNAIITQKKFAERITLSELSVSSGGNYTAYYDDDDLFYGHAVTVYGNNKKGLKSASIEG
jgi:Uncharacterized protein conserved in bacteria